MPTVKTVFVLIYIQLIIFSDKTLGQMVHATVDNDTTQASVFGHDEGSGEVDPVTTEIGKFDTLPPLVVMDALGHPCFLATLNATMHVSYKVPEGIVHETYIALAEIQLPQDVDAQGVCGDNQTRLLLNWGNNTFQINMTFSKNEATTDNQNTTWSLTDMAVSYDLSKRDVFKSSSETEIVTVERHDLKLFTTPVGFTYECDLDKQVALGPSDRGVVVYFHDVTIAAFGVTSSDFPPDVSVCTQEAEQEIEEEILIPLIVACCLSAIVVIIVVAYVISRKIQTSNQSAYKQMP